MGPFYHTKRLQDTIQFNSPSFYSFEKSEPIFLPVITRRDNGTSPETGSGKGTRSGNSWFLFPAISCPEKERKVTSYNRSFSVESVHKETTIQNGDSQVSMTMDSSQQLGCLHRSDRCLSTCSDSSSIQEVPLFHVRKSGHPIHGPLFQTVPKSMDFHQTDGLNHGSFASTCLLTVSLPRRLAHKRSNMQQTYISHNILPSNSTKSRVHSKSKEVRFETSSTIHLHRDGISDTTEYSQGTSRSHQIPTSDYQTISNSDSSFSTNFPFSFGQTQCSSRLSCSRQTSFTTKCVSYLSGHLIFYLSIMKFRSTV